MIWRIAKKEFLLNLMTFRFVVGILLCVVLVAVFVPALLRDYRQSRAEYDRRVAEREAQLRQSKVYLNILWAGRYRLYRPPSVLSVFSAGSQKRLGDSARIELSYVPEIAANPIEVNPYATILPMLDVSIIFAVVLSVLAVLIASDAISGERERGTLRLTLSDRVARHDVLLGKCLAGLMTLLLPLTIAFLVAVLVLVLSAQADLTGSDWARLGLMYVVSLVFVATMYNLGLLASCMTGHSSISLLSALFLWILLVQIVPNAGAYLAAHVDPVEPREEINSRLRAVREERAKEIEKIRNQVRDWGQEVASDDIFGQWCVVVCDEEGMKGRQECFAAWNPVYLRHAERFWQIEHRHATGLLQQKRLADRLARLSPIAAYENAMSALAGTNVASSWHFLDQARAHRTRVIEYLRSRTDNFSSPRYFTQCTRADMAFYQQYLDKKVSEEDFQQWKAGRLRQMPPLDLRDFPRFKYRNDVMPAVRNALADLSTLAFAGLLFLALSFVAFMRYDIR